MSLVLSFEIEGHKQVLRELHTISQGMKDFTKPLEKSGEDLMGDVQLNFAMRGGLYGGWAPRTKPYPWPLLEKTGEMRGGFLSTVADNALRLWNRVPYFRYHQSSLPRRKIPRRVMLMIRKHMKTQIVENFQEYIHNVCKEWGRG